MLIVSHPTGNANLRAVIYALEAAGLLDSFWTSFGLSIESLPGRLLPGSFRAELARRSYRLPKQRLRLQPLREVSRLVAARLGLRSWIRQETGWCSVDAVYHQLDRAVARAIKGGRLKREAVYAYEDGALATFQAARAAGMRCFYDQPIGYWRAARQLMLEEAERSRAWAATLTGNRDSAAKLERKDAELAAADVIFVASTFTAETLKRADAAKGKPLHILPYGAPPPIERAVLDGRLQRLARPGPLRVLFVGGLSQRKGIAEVFAAAEQLKGTVELTVIGRRAADCSALDQALSRCRYIPSLPHGEILREMREHDVLLFPSLFEGFGLVILEAMAQGVPVITTHHTGGRDVITSGVDGELVPIRDVAAIVEKLAGFAADRERLRAMSEAAWRRAADFTWEAYGRRTVEAIRDECSKAARSRA